MNLKYFFTLALLFKICFSFSQNAFNTHVDERTELVSLVCKLADYHEYNDKFSTNPAYIKDLDSCFSKYKSDSLIVFAKTLPRKFGIGYDAPMSLAISLEYNGKFYLNPELTKIQDDRWNIETANKFVDLLNRFYVKTNFHQFFEQHKALYSKMASKFDSCMNDINIGWYEKFYGEKSKGSFSVILSGIIGGNNYGTKNVFKNGAENCHSIMGAWIFDSTYSIPAKWKNSVKSVLIHEFNHSFCNPLIYKYLDGMEKNATKMYKCVKPLMKRQAYGQMKIMMCELLVRSCVTRYMTEIAKIDSIKTHEQLVGDKLHGFYWIDTVCYTLQQYEKQRDKYPTLDSYMPEFVRLINSLETKEIIKRVNANKVDFVVQSSIKNGDLSVNPDTKELILTFNRKMYPWTFGTSKGKKGYKYSFNIREVHLNEKNANEWKLKIELEPNKEYSIAFPQQHFYDENGNQGKRKVYYLDFKTGDKK